MSIHACDSDPSAWRRVKRRLRRTILAVSLAAGAAALSAGAVELPDPSRLPPPLAADIVFDRDVAPILRENCLRCHGEERPKSGFSLASRERALQGGYEGVDIVPGDSAASPLIHYVARVVTDMEMPPEGSGEPLTDAQVSLLRAWIDQGARWNETPEVQTTGSVTPAVSWSTVDGDTARFRELEGIPDGWRGGLEEFSFTRRHRDGRKVEVEGRVFAPDDYRLRLDLSRPGLGFVGAGLEQWTRYYDDLGGYNPLATPATYRLGEPLGLDIGKAWVELGLALPRAPEMTLGYEYHFRQGDKSTLQWGLANGRAIYPASKSIDETLHLLRFDFLYELWGWTIEDNARVEWYRNETRRLNTLQQAPPPVRRVTIDEEGGHLRGANAFRIEKQLTDWWLFSAAHFYSRLDGDASYQHTTVDATGAPTLGSFWSADRIELDSESHVFSLAGLIQPLRPLSISLGLQNEHTRQTGFGPINLDAGDPTNPFLFPLSADADLDRWRWSEFVNLRFTGIPFTVVFADLRLDQEDGNQFEQELGNLPQPVLLRSTDFTTRRGDWRVGMQISQWRVASVNLHYRGQFNDNDYNHLQDQEFGFNEGYPAFIRGRDVDSESVRAALTLKPSTWLQARLSYEYRQTQYSVDTDPLTLAGAPGGWNDSGTSRGNHSQLGVTLKPWRRLGLGAAAGYVDSVTSTARNGIDSVQDYAGHSWWVRGTARFVLTADADLFASYEYWRSDYGQTHAATGLPLGSDYTRHSLQIGLKRKWNDRLTSSLRYGFHDFDDAATGGAGSYTAHGLFAAITYEWD